MNFIFRALYKLKKCTTSFHKRMSDNINITGTFKITHFFQVLCNHRINVIINDAHLQVLLHRKSFKRFCKKSILGVNLNVKYYDRHFQSNNQVFFNWMFF